jgi:hypothetical protein
VTEERAKRKLAAIFSVDVKGYSRLMADDEEATVRTINSYREVMTGLIIGHAGRVVDAKGDNVLAEFPSVVDAVRCAVQVQNELKERNSELSELMSVPIESSLMLFLAGRAAHFFRNIFKRIYLPTVARPMPQLELLLILVLRQRSSLLCMIGRIKN